MTLVFQDTPISEGDSLQRSVFRQSIRYVSGDLVSGVHWIALDVETTGLSIQRGHRLHQIALLDDFGGSLVTDALPSTPRAAEVAKLRGVSPSAPDFGELANEVIRLLKRGVVVGHNVTFDLRFIDIELDRLGLSLPEVAFVDTLCVSGLLGISGTLSEVALSLGLETEPHKLHEATYDARLSRDVLRKAIEVAGFETLGDLMVRRYSAYRGAR